jgi:hypothetical protein
MTRSRSTLLVILAGASTSLMAQARPAAPSSLTAAIDSRAPAYSAVARRIWEFAEVGYQEE